MAIGGWVEDVGMVDLPSGTVTLVFSDVEGSTLLLSRLGPAYIDALDGQRSVLRSAWAKYGGIELGTEGDSFFVVFASARDAVCATVEAQRELHAYPWPQGEQVRVRMGVHTGSPQVHDGGYVGLDVHRAARIAGAAHGGQIVVSLSTAELVSTCMPPGTALKPKGSHRLKDLPEPVQLLQVAIDGLPEEFPPLKTLGAVSTLPCPATPLVGRDHEVEELTALLSSPDVQLLTLTGPGGSGKTRLAVEVAQRLVEAVPDGVYFTALAGVSTEDALWSSLAETLNVRPEARNPPGVINHVSRRSALFVLDNLEQLPSAHDVVTEILAAAPRTVVIATSRRPLHVIGEHEYPVPPLPLPDGTDVDVVAASPAVQMFVYHARLVRPSFTVTRDNAADVAALCRHLDGLPLAIELAAARSKLLTPSAILNRLGTVLDLGAGGSPRPSRQQTLRNTIRWSYDLLSGEEQTLFRRLGVFSGGADLHAVAAVAGGDRNSSGRDCLDLVAELVDASLVTVGETAEGEPRVDMLETIRTFALEQLACTGELDAIAKRHAEHFVAVAEGWQSLMSAGRFFEARDRFEVETDNIREALDWALRRHEGTAPSAEAVGIGLSLCRVLVHLWDVSGYHSEGRSYLAQAIQLASGRSDSPEMAGCLNWMSIFSRNMGDLEDAYPWAEASVSMWRRLNDGGAVALALETLARLELYRGQPTAARAAYEEALRQARQSDDKAALEHVLVQFALMEHSEGNYQHSLELDAEALAVARERNDDTTALMTQHNTACTLRQLGRAEEAKRTMDESIPAILGLDNLNLTMALAEDYAAVLADIGDFHGAGRLLGAADAMRARLTAPRDRRQELGIAGTVAKARGALGETEWEAVYQAGMTVTVEEALSVASGVSASTRSVA